MGFNDAFLERVAKKLEDLGLRETELQQQLEAITEERTRYEAAWRVYQEEMKDQAGAEPVPAPGRLGDDTLAGMTIADASAAILREAGGEMKLTDLIRRLRHAGTTKAKGTSAYSSVLKTMQRSSDRFYQIRRGQWGLVEMRDQVKEGRGITG
jgi:hypothetical protein